MDITPDISTTVGPVSILAPFDRPGEVALLGRAGAAELYAGVHPDPWRGERLSSNQRTFAAAQFDSEAQFAEAVAEAKTEGLPVHLTLNAPLYDPAAYPVLMGLAERAAGWGVQGIIAGDLGLLERLRRAKLPLELTLSTLAGAWNRSTVAFFQKLGVSRVVLPRHLSLDEMGTLAGAHPEVRFEAFVMVGKCPNAEALCSFQHTAPDRRWPCEIPYQLSTAEGAPLAEDHPLGRWQRRWQGCDRRAACGLCAIPELLRRGIRHLKVVGRGGPTTAKAANVELVTRFAKEGGFDAARAAYQERYGRRCDRLICYYPELWEADE